MLNWIKRHWILSLFLLVGGVPAGLNYSGFCIEQGRWLSDEEFLLAMLGYTEGDTIRNEERKKHLKEHPECCSLYRGSIGMSDPNFEFIDRIFGFPYASGTVEYKRSEEERRLSNWDDEYYRHYVSISTCGKVHFDAGESIDKKHSYYRNK